MLFLSRLAYNTLLLLGLFWLFPIWLSYLLLIPKTRAGFWQKLGLLPRATAERFQAPKRAKRIWFHAVSVGEVNAIRSLAEALQTDYEILISTTTLTGQNLAQRLFKEAIVFYFPFDLPVVIHSILKLSAPDLVVVAETELWPNFIDQVRAKHQIPLIVINGRLSQRSYKGYQWIQWLIRPFLQQISHFYMQAQADADRIQQLGNISYEKITVAGNLKFDLTSKVQPDKRAELASLLGITEKDTVLTLASTHSGEDLPLLEAYLGLKRDFPELKLILAPRHPERVSEIKGILNSKAVQYAIRSQLGPETSNLCAIIVLDSIGELLTIYSFSTVAVMGGSFIERGGQNPLEALSQRVPVVFGPHMQNFSEISRLILENQAGFQVQNTNDLVQAVTTLLTQPEIYDEIAENGQRLLENNRGAKEILRQAILKKLST